jgi:hypothetical protein
MDSLLNKIKPTNIRTYGKLAPDLSMLYIALLLEKCHVIEASKGTNHYIIQLYSLKNWRWPILLRK